MRRSRNPSPCWPRRRRALSALSGAGGGATQSPPPAPAQPSHPPYRPRYSLGPPQAAAVAPEHSHTEASLHLVSPSSPSTTGQQPASSQAGATRVEALLQQCCSGGGGGGGGRQRQRQQHPGDCGSDSLPAPSQRSRCALAATRGQAASIVLARAAAVGVAAAS